MNYVLATVIGFILGAVTVIAVGLQAFRLAALYQRTGHASNAPVKDAVVHGAIPVNPEVSAHRRIMADAVDQGAAVLQQLARDNGESLSVEDARLQAERMLRGENPLGGVS